MLSLSGAHQQAAIASAFDRQFGRSGVMLLDQILRGGSKVIEHVLLLGQIAGPVPSFTVFSAAPEVGHDVNKTVVEQRPDTRRERWTQTDVVPAIGREQYRILAIQLGALTSDDIQRDPGAIL